MTKRILLVDDDSTLSELLGEYLTNEGFEVSISANAESAMARFEAGERFDLWVLDIMMPGLSGLELLQQMRPRLKTPVILLTGRGDDIDKILGLEMGADDYLAKPANPRELLARIRAVLRRSEQAESLSTSRSFPTAQLNVGPISLDPQMRKAAVNSIAIELTSAEFNVLAYLLQSAGELVTKEDLTEKVLHRKLTAYDRAIDMHVSRVRAKLEEVQLGLSHRIKTIRGQGYQFIVPAGNTD